MSTRVEIFLVELEISAKKINIGKFVGDNCSIGSDMLGRYDEMYTHFEQIVNSGFWWLYCDSI